MTSSSGRLALVRDLAVSIVDMKHGYTVEFSGNAASHRDEYDVLAEAIDIALGSLGLRLLKTLTPETDEEECR